MKIDRTGLLIYLVLLAFTTWVAYILVFQAQIVSPGWGARFLFVLWGVIWGLCLSGVPEAFLVVLDAIHNGKHKQPKADQGNEKPVR